MHMEQIYAAAYYQRLAVSPDTLMRQMPYTPNS